MACIACHMRKKKCVPVEGQDRCKYCISKDIECHPHISQQGRRPQTNVKDQRQTQARVNLQPSREFE